MENPSANVTALTSSCRQVLVVEDEGLIALDLKHRLNRFGYEVPGIAETADDAVQLAVRHNPDLVLMDIWLKGVRDGIHAATELRRRMDVPIIFLTAHADADTLKRAAETDPYGFIVKPFSPADLRAQIEVAHGRYVRTRRFSGAAKRGEPEITPLQVSAVAHDFNNLLMLIMSNAEALRSMGDSAEIEQIRRASQLATMLCRQLLPSASRPAAAPASEMNSVIRANVHLIERALGSRCRVLIDLAPGDLRVGADEGQLSRICLNLALNARNAMPFGGELRIGTRKVAHSLVELTIADNGMGMDADTLERIFDPFYSSDPGTGTGLGLTIVQGIVRQAGGAISVESEPRAGSRFAILLPLVQAKAAAAGVATPAAASLSSPSSEPRSPAVLLVEDQSELRTLVRDHLRLAGVDPLCARDSEEAIALLARRGAGVDLLVTDVSLPGMTGPELAAHCIGESLCSRVLFMSGYAAHTFGRKSPLLVGRADFIAKPFTASEIAAKVKKILESLRP